MITFTEIIDQACPAAIAAEDAGKLPTRMFVNPKIYDSIADIRRSELDNGFPLILLGMYLESDERLPETGFRFGG